MGPLLVKRTCYRPSCGARSRLLFDLMQVLGIALKAHPFKVNIMVSWAFVLQDSNVSQIWWSNISETLLVLWYRFVPVTCSSSLNHLHLSCVFGPGEGRGNLVQMCRWNCPLFKACYTSVGCKIQHFYTFIAHVLVSKSTRYTNLAPLSV